MRRDQHPISQNRKSVREKVVTEKKFSTPQEPSQYHGDLEEFSPIVAELLDHDQLAPDQKTQTHRGINHGTRRAK